MKGRTYGGYIWGYLCSQTKVYYSKVPYPNEMKTCFDCKNLGSYGSVWKCGGEVVPSPDSVDAEQCPCNDLEEED